MEKRKHPRFDSLNLSYVCIDEKHMLINEGMGRTLNISESGILLEVYFPVMENQVLSLTIALEDELIEICGRVIHRKTVGNGKFLAGIQFMPMDPDTQNTFKKYIKLVEDVRKSAGYMMKKDGLFETNFPELSLIKRGKVRDIYDLGDCLLMVATDRISAFDVVMPDPIPGKGKILTKLSLFWFKMMEPLVENHVITGNVDEFPEICKPYAEVLRDRSMLVKKTEPLAIECVVRGYISGSGWKSYLASGSVCGIALPQGLRESDKLETPLFTPSTKAEIGFHDENIDFEQAAKIVGEPFANKVRELSLEIYKKGRDFADDRGIIIADTKFEFGLLGDQLILIDEILTPDSSRFWPKAQYQPGGSQVSFDKQYLRDYLESLDWDKKPPAPSLPEEVIANTLKKYQEACELLAG